MYYTAAAIILMLLMKSYVTNVSNAVLSYAIYSENSACNWLKKNVNSDLINRRRN